jgi:hypothetical protein
VLDCASVASVRTVARGSILLSAWMGWDSAIDPTVVSASLALCPDGGVTFVMGVQ